MKYTIRAMSDSRFAQRFTSAICLILLASIMLQGRGQAQNLLPDIGPLGAKNNSATTIPSVKLSIDKSTQGLTENAVLSATVTPTSNVSSYKFEIKRKASSDWYSLQSNGNNSFKWVRRVAGQFHLRVKVTIATATYTSKIVGAETQFPTYSDILENTDISKAMYDAWTSTKNYATATRYREEGFAILLDTAGTGTYFAASTTYGNDFTPPDVPSAGIPSPSDDPPSPMPNASGVVYNVAFFHTHPAMTYISNQFSRDVGPSANDIVAAYSGIERPGIVYDYIEAVPKTGEIPGGHPVNSPARPYHFGPSRRPTPKL